MLQQISELLNPTTWHGAILDAVIAGLIIGAIITTRRNKSNINIKGNENIVIQGDKNVFRKKR